MSPAVNGSPTLQCFERGNSVKICNRMMFDFYPGLPRYAGDLSSITTTTTGINHLNSAYLKSVLLYHNMPTIGTKEQLVLRTHLPRKNGIADIVAGEQGQLTDLINIAQKVILEQR